FCSVMGKICCTMRLLVLGLLSLVFAGVSATADGPQPNFVFILTDDQDKVLDGMLPLTETIARVGDKGATFSNAFVASPLCCPSRSSLLTGRHVHNHGAFNNTPSGQCSGLEWQAGPETQTFAVSLQEAGYTTFYAGKYLNAYGQHAVGGVEHIPPGYDHWMGLVGNSRYYNYTLSVDGVAEMHGDNFEDDYLTNIIRKRGMDFLESADLNNPFLLVLSTPAPHDPFTPEPKYSSNFSDLQAPRTPSFNIVNGEDKNWFLKQGPQPLSDDVIANVDEIFRMRLQTLLTVDDMVKDVLVFLEDNNILDNTFVIFTSDHGYHLGQFSLPTDKREPYETDIRVPLLISGPGIEAGIHIDYGTINIDLAPTIIDLAGIPIPEYMDGLSLKPLLLGSTDQSKTKAWTSRTMLVEHMGEGIPQGSNPQCEDAIEGMCWCKPYLACKCEDHPYNTYSCIRHVAEQKDGVFCKWSNEGYYDHDYNFEEYYNLKIDPHQLNNSVSTLPSEEYDAMLLLLQTLKACKGSECIWE
ncbi:unnamed protein product, partial [Meganyctiphanes norvegica]